MTRKTKKSAKTLSVATTTQEERADYAQRMITTLMLSNYGFEVVDQKRPHLPVEERNQLVTWSRVRQLRAVKELQVRLKVFEIKGGQSQGSIPFPEANRKIEYIFNDQSIGKCHLSLKAISSKKAFLYNDD